MATREQIYQALFALVTPLQASSPGSVSSAKPFVTVTREVQEIQKFKPGEQPALMLYEMDESFSWQATPAVQQTMDCWFIIGATTTKGTAGATVLNPLIDAVQNVLKPPVGQTFQTLGNLVQSVKIKRVIKDVGDNNPAEVRQAAASLQVEIIAPTI